ncbi:unnamed protein product, partial [marine sediment metagenome]
FDLASHLEPTDAAGRFRGDGFPQGGVTVAVRRGPGHEWVLAEPQPVASDIVITLGESLDLTLRIESVAGRPVEDLALEVLTGQLDDPTITLRRLGLLTPVVLDGRVSQLGDDTWRIADLEAGRYLVGISARGHAAALLEVELDSDSQLEVELEQAVAYGVSVTNPQGRPLPGAAIFAKPVEGEGPPTPIPVHCGYTDADGYLRITQVHAEKIQVTAQHPAYGTVESVAELGTGEIKLVMEQPGSIQGLLVENGQPPEPGKYSIVLESQLFGDYNLLRHTPRFAAVDPQGHFEFGSVQPGSYQLLAIDSPASATSIGRLLSLVERWDREPSSSATVRVRAAEIAEAKLAIGGDPGDQAATTRALGSVLVDG